MNNFKKCSRLSLSLLILLYFLTGCKKESAKPSSDKYITTFLFKVADNSGILSSNVTGILGTDTIKVGVKEHTVLSHLVPTISFKGAGISPGSLEAQNFSGPVKYTVTAEDGSKHIYTVIVYELSTVNLITSFILESKNNPSLSVDVSGDIKGDSITFALPLGTAVTDLIPTILYTGKTITPASGNHIDLSKFVYYNVEAEDGSQRSYVVSGSNNTIVYFGSFDGYIYALNAANGAVIWKFKTEDKVFSTPTYFDNTLYIGGDKHFYAFNARTGQVKWARLDFYPSNFSCTPVYSEGVIYVTDSGNNFFAFNAADGTIKWLNFTEGFGTGTSPTVYKNVVYLTSPFGSITAYEKNTGIKLWINSTGMYHANACVANGTVYTGGEAYKIIAFDGLTGEKKWVYSDQNFGAFYNSPTLYEGFIFSIGNGGYCYAIDTISHVPKWIYKSHRGNTKDPVCGNGKIFIAANGNISAVNTTTGVEEWSYDFSGQINNSSGHPGYANNTVYVGLDHYLYALNASTGTVLWRYMTNDFVPGGVCIIDVEGHIYHSGDSGEQQ